MNWKYPLLVFDWDGTLLDSAGTIVACMQAAARDLGFPAPDASVARQVIGLGLTDALCRAMPEVPVAEHARVTERYRFHYLAQDQELSLFAGAPELIGHLHDSGRLLAVATGKSRAGLDRALAASGLGDFFQITRCADECSSKPAPDMLLEIMAELAVDPVRTLMIGDTTHDLQMARNAGVDALAVGFGAHSPASLRAERPLAILEDFDEISGWLETHG